MPTEIGERNKHRSYNSHGGTGEIAEVTDHRESNGNHKSNSFASLRSQQDYPGSNSFRRRSGTVPTARSLRQPSPDPPQLEGRVKDVISRHEQRSKQTNGGATVRSRSNGRRASSGRRLPAAGGSNGGEEELFDIPLAKPQSEIQPASPSLPSSKDVPAVKYMDQVPKRLERRASSREKARADRPVAKANGDVPATKELRRSSSFSKLPNPAKASPADKKPSPASLPRRQSLTNSRPTNSSREASRTEKPGESRPYSRSTSGLSERRGSRGPSSSNNLNLKQENRRLSGTKSRPVVQTRSSSDEDLEIDHEFVAEDAESTSYKPTSKPSIDMWKRDVGANGTSRRDDAHADSAGRLYTRMHSMTRKPRQEDPSDSSSDSRRKSRNPRPENVPPMRLESIRSNGSMTSIDPIEDPTNDPHAHVNQRRVTGSGLKEALASGTRERPGERRMTIDAALTRRTSASKRPVNPYNRGIRVALKGVAAASYNNGWLPFDGMVPFPDDIAGLNRFLYDCKGEVEAGVPGSLKLTVVLGKDSSDLDSIVSTILYAYFLSCTASEEDRARKCFAPVINMRREDLVLHTEAVWLFKVAGVDTSNFIFVTDDINLLYFQRFGHLELVLVNHSRLAPHQESLKDVVIEIVDNTLSEELYSWVETRDIQEVGSCCTIIAERFVAEAAEYLAGRGINRLLLGPILLETANLDAKSACCTQRDEKMAALLINGAGRYGQQGFFRFLRKMKFDISELSTMDMLRKDFKQWTLGPGRTNENGFKGREIKAAMSTLGVSLREILYRKDILDDLRRFQRKSGLDLHLVVTGYYDNTDCYKREILLVPEDTELTQHLLTCFSQHREALQLSSIQVKGLPHEMLVFRQGLVTASRKILRQILVEYFAM